MSPENSKSKNIIIFRDHWYPLDSKENRQNAINKLTQNNTLSLKEGLIKLYEDSDLEIDLKKFGL